MGPWAHREHARSMRRGARASRIRCMNMRMTARATLQDGGRGYALEAVAALGIDAARVFKTIVVAVDGRLGIAIVPADGEVDLKGVADALGGRKAAVAPPAEAERATGYVLGGISPLGHPAAAAHGARRQRSGLADDPRLSRPARPRDRAGRGGPRRAHRRASGTDRPAGLTASASRDLRPLGNTAETTSATTSHAMTATIACSGRAGPRPDHHRRRRRRRSPT